MKTFIGIVIGILTVVQIIAMVILGVHQTQNCTGHLKRAADANTIELALSEMNTAIAYLDEKGLTKGYTSVLWRTPDEDIGFFYTNLINSRDELLTALSSETQLEKSNVLMKLRETLLDNGEKGTQLTYPDGLARYPNNLMYGLFWCALLVLWGGFILWVAIDSDY